MKRSFPCAIVLSLALGLTAIAASAADGTITINGAIDAATCSVTGSSGLSGGATANFTVALARVSSSSMTAVGATAAKKPFHISLSGAGCTDTKKVRAYFHPALVDVDTTHGTLRNQVVAGSNVQVQLLDGQSSETAINLAQYDEAQLGQVTITGNTATLVYWAQYFAPAAVITPGAYTSSLEYDIDYE